MRMSRSTNIIKIEGSGGRGKRRQKPRDRKANKRQKNERGLRRAGEQGGEPATP